MPNIQTLTNLRAATAYKRASVIDAMRNIEKWAAGYETLSDSLALATAADLADTVTQVTDSAATPYLVIIESPAAASNGVYVQLFNIDDTDVTLGTSAPRLVFFCPAEETVCFAIHSAGSGNLFGTGCSMASTTTHDGNTAPAAADRADVTVLYAT